MEALSGRLDWRSEEEYARIGNRRNTRRRREKEIRLGKKRKPSRKPLAGSHGVEMLADCDLGQLER